MKIFIKVLATILFSLIVFSCGRETYKNAQVDTLMSPEEKYINNIARITGDVNSKIVIVNLQGGPEPTLDPLIYNQVPNVDKYIIKFKKSLFVSVHQYQTLHAEELRKKDITFEQAKKYSSQSSQMVVDVIQYYKKQGKIVFVIGTSYGAFVAVDTILKIQQKHLIQADKYAILVGRLDLQDLVWKTFSTGASAEVKDGVVPTADKLPKDFATNKEYIINKNMNRLAAGLGYKRYTKLLANAPLDNVIYFFGEKDERVGKLSDNEIKFLVRKKARVFPVPNASHEQVSGSLGQVIDLLMQDVK